MQNKDPVGTCDVHELTYSFQRCMVVDGNELECTGSITVPFCDGNDCEQRPCCRARTATSHTFEVQMVCETCSVTYEYGPIEVPTSCECTD